MGSEFVVNTEKRGGKGQKLGNDEEDVGSNVVVLTDEQGQEGQDDGDTEGGSGDGFFKEAGRTGHRYLGLYSPVGDLNNATAGEWLELFGNRNYKIFITRDNLTDRKEVERVGENGDEVESFLTLLIPIPIRCR